MEHRIGDLQRQLDAIERRRKREVAARRGQMTVSLVGYTNAGKSTLMNVLTGADVHVEDELFATLDTRTRRWQLPGWGPVLLSDTVGFIRDLPHHLIASFKATLEEARAGRPAVARGRRRQSGGVRADRRGLPGAGGTRHPGRRTRCWCSTRSTPCPTAPGSTAC